MIAGGRPKLDRKITRDGADVVELECHRSLPPVLRRLRDEGYHIVGLEQTTRSVCLFQYGFRPRTVLVVGHERQGLDEATLAVLEAVVEIPVFGLPYSHNVATATAMAMYEYCRQFARL
jgi:tRNA G18 (ribose-2'-O)-methylase SpoU